jgi:hypothetical protein
VEWCTHAALEGVECRKCIKDTHPPPRENLNGVGGEPSVGLWGSREEERPNKQDVGAHRACSIPSKDPAAVGELVLQPGILSLPTKKVRRRGGEGDEWSVSLIEASTCNEDKENTSLIALSQNKGTLST